MHTFLSTHTNNIFTVICADFTIYPRVRTACFRFLWLRCIADADIIFSSCAFFFLLSVFFFSLAYSQPPQIGCLPYFHTWCGLSANLGCRSETYCTRLAENRGRKNHHKFAILAPSNNFVRLGPISSQLRHVSTIGQNLLKSNIFPYAVTIL